ncbi:hypothetical protein EXIGUO9Y_340010 [Exiguobacterium oxidotolerans]|uniref:Uncharacterized protein n=1 Tax=Exiguobacterium oxidotolerans TaxID=223958 RepID=A0A653IF20_9BACL|nr:hypothetical protein EXIGUO9Y_340010 [Exiguobacterium oxidotolerans]
MTPLSTSSFFIHYTNMLFILNLDLASHLTNEFTLQNTSFSLSLIVMIATIAVALGTAFSIFNRKDMLV